MKLKNIVLVLENCDTINIPGKYVGDIELTELKTEISRWACNSIDKLDFCEYFFIEIYKDANIIDYAFDQIEEDFQYNKFDRLHQYNDITSIELTLVDENNKETIYQYYVSYEEKEPGKLGSPNIYQSSYISNLGNLYILIAKNKKIDEVIDYNVINDEKNMDFHFTMFDIGEES